MDKNYLQNEKIMQNVERIDEYEIAESNPDNVIQEDSLELDTTESQKQLENAKRLRKNAHNRHAVKQPPTAGDKSSEAIHANNTTSVSGSKLHSKVGGHPPTSKLHVDRRNIDPSSGNAPSSGNNTQTMGSTFSAPGAAYSDSDDGQLNNLRAGDPTSSIGDNSAASRQTRPDLLHQSSEPRLLGSRHPAPLFSRSESMPTAGAAQRTAPAAPELPDPSPRQQAAHGLNKYLRRIFPNETPAAGAAGRRGSQEDGPWPRRQGTKVMSAEELKLWDPWVPATKWRAEARFIGENRPGPPPPHPTRGAGAAPRKPRRPSPARGPLGADGAGGGDGRAGGAGVEDGRRAGGRAGAFEGAGLGGSSGRGPSSLTGAQVIQRLSGPL